MVKFHVSPDGMARPCNAGSGPNARGCMYNYIDAEHYETRKEAAKAAERKFVEENGGSFVSKKKKPINVDYGSLSMSDKINFSMSDKINLSGYDKIGLIMSKDSQAMDVFVSDPDPRVRLSVAELGSDSHRDVLVNDKDWRVRAAVAMFGTNEHRDKLMLDENARVRMMVAENGSVEQVAFLINDKDVWVRMKADKRFNSLG